MITAEERPSGFLVRFQRDGFPLSYTKLTLPPRLGLHIVRVQLLSPVFNNPVLTACQEVSASNSVASPLWKSVITAGNSRRDAKKLRTIMETISCPTTM